MGPLAGLGFFDALGLVALLLAVGVYVRGWVWLHRRMPHRFGWGQLAAFVAGVDALLVALAPALDALAARSLTAHMLQHLLLMLVAPPLLWLGQPLAPLLRGLPPPAMRTAIGLLAWRPVRRAGCALAHPAVAWLSFSTMAWAWHVPALYELALRSHAWHHVEHAAFLGTALMFWWPVIRPWPARPRWPRSAFIPYLMLAEVQNVVLAAVLAFGGRVLYPTYAQRLGASALEDQVTAGLLMWGPGSLIFLLPAGWLMLRLLAPARMTRGTLPSRARAAPRPGAMMG